MDPLSAVAVAGSALGVVASFSAWRSVMPRNVQRLTSFGIHKLEDEPESPAVDICFVHGLDGDPFKTWSSTGSDTEDNFFWPDDVQKQTNGRILLYGYNTMAPTAEYLSRRTLYHQAIHLAESLANERRDDPRRPLIFVAHSLGGIVVKSSLIISSQRTHTEDLVPSVAGIVFLGTPHKVHSHLASAPGSVLQRIANISGLNRSTIKHLDKESGTLQSYLEPFVALSNDIPMISFFESRTTKSFGIIVPPSTAVHGPRNETIMLDSNHANLTKFRGPADENYVRVLSAIQKLCKEAGFVVNSRRKSEQKEFFPYGDADSRRENFRYPYRLQPESPQFSGRDNELKWIADALLKRCPPDCTNQCHTVNLYGLGGVGKTQIALAFAYRFQDRFSSVFWISAQSRNSIERGFKDIARCLHLLPADTEDEGSTSEAVQSVLEWLKTSRNTKWLLIFDDVVPATPEVLDLIPSTTCVHGHTIVTSRVALGLPFATAYKVNPLQAAESKMLLMNYLSRSILQDPDVDKLIEALGGFPLALSQAAALMSKSRMMSKDYLDMFSETRSKILSDLPSDDRSLEKVFSTSMDKISGLPAELLFSMCCMLSLESIPLWIFEEGSKSFSSKRVLRRSISTLEDLALISRQLYHNHLQVHRLVRDYARRAFPAEIESEACRELCETASYVAVTLKQTGATYLGPASDSAHSFEKELIELTVDGLSMILSHHPSSMEWNVSFEELGNVCWTHDRFAESAKFYTLLLEKIKGPETLISRTKLKLAILRRHTGESSGTDPSVSDESLGAQMQEAVRAAPDDETMQELKLLNREQKDPEQELQVLRVMIEAQEERLGYMDPSTLESVLEISLRLVDQGFLNEAEAALRRVLVSYHKLYGTHNRNSTRVAEHVASVCVSLHKLDEAEAMWKLAIEDYEMRLGKDHPSTQKCLAQLALTYYLQGRCEEAESLFLDAIETLLRTAGPDSPDVLRTQHNYALNLAKLGKVRENHQELTRKSRQLLEDVLHRMEAHPETHPMKARRRTAIQLFQMIEKDSSIREGDKDWALGRHLQEKYGLKKYVESNPARGWLTSMGMQHWA